MASIETPSRIWRRIEANEAQSSDMPSLPSLPEFDTTASKDLDHSYFPSEPPYMHSPPKLVQQPMKPIVAAQQKTVQAMPKRLSIPDQVSLLAQPKLDARTGHEQTDLTHVTEGSTHILPSMNASFPLDSLHVDEVDMSLQSLDDDNASGTKSSVDQYTFHASLSRSLSGSKASKRLSTDSIHASTKQSSSLDLSLTSMISASSEESTEVLQQPTPPIEPLSEDFHENPATPRTRRKSFLLNVIHSTARPRMAMPTPHPQSRFSQAIQSTPYSGQDQLGEPTPRGGTLVRRARFSLPHQPLATPATRMPDSIALRGTSVSPFASNGSFVSTASSHDLTVHPRINTSFDPATGATGVGRFNAGKLNTYLHGLNRRLQEENESLINQLRRLQEENASLFAKRASEADLSELRENSTAEKLVQQVDALEIRNTHLHNELLACREDRDSALHQLEEERGDRGVENERWTSRIIELEGSLTTLTQLVEELEERNAGLSKNVAAYREERDNTSSQLEEEKVKRSEDSARWKSRVNEAENNGAVLERQVDELQKRNARLQEELNTYQKERDNALYQFEDERANRSRENRSWRNKIDEAEGTGAVLVQQVDGLEARISQLENELASSRKDRDSALQRLEEEKANRSLDKERWRSRVDEVEGSVTTLVQQLENKLEVAERNATTHAEAVKTLQSIQERLQKENAELQEALTLAYKATANTNINASFATPRHVSGVSPMHRQVLSVKPRTPKTPGGALRDLSWLSSTPVDQTTAALLTEVQRLQDELDQANESIDNKIVKLEEAGMDVVTATKELGAARAKIALLENQLAQRDAALATKITSTKCSICGGDPSYPSQMKTERAEKKRLTIENSEIKNSIAGLQHDVEQVRNEVVSLGMDVRRMNTSKAKDAQKRDAQSLTVETMRIKHKKQCKGLMVQIRYLKAKFTRESSFRADLVSQKQYLLSQVERFGRSEQKVLALIASVSDIPLSIGTAGRPRMLRSWTKAIIFTLRVRRLSQEWQKHRSSREAVTEAWQAIRQKRLEIE